MSGLVRRDDAGMDDDGQHPGSHIPERVSSDRVGTVASSQATWASYTFAGARLLYCRRARRKEPRWTGRRTSTISSIIIRILETRAAWTMPTSSLVEAIPVAVTSSPW